MAERVKYGEEKYRFPDGSGVKVGGLAWQGSLYGNTYGGTCETFTVGVFMVEKGSRGPKAGKVKWRVRAAVTREGFQRVAKVADELCKTFEEKEVFPYRRMTDTTLG